MNTINCAGNLLDLKSPKIMGILNITPDSFYAHSRVNSSTALQQATEMINQGAHLLDIGGQSSRPGAQPVGQQQEIDRVVPVIQQLAAHFPHIILSVDTYNAAVAQAAVQAGAHIVNDISAGELDSQMLPTVAKLQVPYIAMHMQGRPSTMQHKPTYSNVSLEVMQYLQQRVQAARTAGITDIILDPGFGFGKTIQHNYMLLAQLASLKILDLPILVGLSRKSMIYKSLQIEPEQALNGTTFLHAIALQHGASILRVHDVAAAAQCLKLHQLLLAKD